MKKIILAAAAFAALASTSAIANPTCLQIGQVDNWKVLDDKTLVVSDEFHNRFRVSLMGVCPSLSFKERLGFKSNGATRMSCLAAGDQVVVRNIGTGGQVCPIRSVVPYTAEMEKADMAAAAAKADAPH